MKLEPVIEVFSRRLATPLLMSRTPPSEPLVAAFVAEELNMPPAAYAPFVDDPEIVKA